MGIKDLTKVIYDHAPEAIKEIQMKSLFGRKVAIDTPTTLYQFLIAVRPDAIHNLTNAEGQTTSHLQGLFYRTIKLVNNGIKPCFVFDGTPPELKQHELDKRKASKQDAKNKQQEAIDKGDTEAVVKLSKRTVSVTREIIEESKKLLRLMGMPVIDAPEEAEATCAAMAKAGVVYAAGSEDTDTLTFGAPLVIRNLTVEGRKTGIREVDLNKALEGLKLSMDQFIDLCILLGSDYCPTIRGIGKVKALELITKHKTIEEILNHIDTEKYPPPEQYNYQGARELFKSPRVVDTSSLELKWTEPNVEELLQFLVVEKGFSEDRVKSSLDKLKKALHEPKQERITNFFTVQEGPKRKKENEPENKPEPAKKRKIKSKKK